MAGTQYLTDEEIPDYCDLLPVTKSQVIFASGIIDSFVGRVNGGSKFQAFTATETVRPNRRGVVKLTHTPVISVDKVALQVPNAFRFTSDVEVPADELYYDESGCIQIPDLYEMPVTPVNLYGRAPVAFKITYSYGYAEIPEAVKLASVLIFECNNGNMNGIKISQVTKTAPLITLTNSNGWTLDNMLLQSTDVEALKMTSTTPTTLMLKNSTLRENATNYSLDANSTLIKENVIEE